MIGLLALGPAVVHGADQLLALGVQALGRGVEVGHQPVAQAQLLLHDGRRLRPVRPRLLGREQILGGMQPHDGRKHAEFQPARGHFVVARAVHVAADVVAPPRVADVGGRRGEVRLEVQRVPGDDGVAREAHRAAVRAGACVARQDQAAPAVALRVAVVPLVEHPHGIQPLDAAHAALLPVDPPEVHALVLQRAVQLLEIRLHERVVRCVKVDAQLLLGIAAHRAAEGLVLLLVGLHAARRVQVERDAQPAVVHLAQESRGIGEEVLIPRVARPAAAVGHVGQVPVHVEHRHRQRHVVRRKVVQ